LSQDLPKITIPGRKRAYRLYGKDGKPLIDYMALASEEPPAVGGDGVICRHPFRQQHRLKVFPSRVEPLHHLVFDGKVVEEEIPKDLSRTREYVLKQIQDSFPESMTRYDDPKEYNVMVSLQLYGFLHSTWEKEAPIDEME
jgi:nicotinate phosphoribosyltransferase